MSKILIIYGSSTGNTESIAEEIAKQVQAAGHKVEVKNAADLQAVGLAEGYDAVLLGASAWGLDELEVQDDFAPLLDKFGVMGLAGKKVAAFASGDSSYTHFCGAVDTIEKNAKDAGATIITDGLRVEGDSHSDPKAISAFVSKILKAL